MSDRAFALEVVTPERVVVSRRDVVSLVAPGALGYLGVLANHSPLMAELTVGHLDFRRTDGSTDSMAVSGGFLEVLRNKVTVLAETAELKDEIDVERAQRALLRAQERLAAPSSDIDLARADAALMRALNRLRVARRQ